MTGTMTGAEVSLRSLRDRPFELLKELEKRSRTVAAGSVTESDAGKEWVGVAFRMGGETFLVAREETREVLGIPGHGDAHPRREELGEGPGQRARPAAAHAGPAPVPGLLRRRPPAATRALWWSTTAISPPASWSTRCLGFRRFAEPEFSPEPPPTVIRCDSYLAGAFRRGGEVWPVLSLKALVESPGFLQAAS